MHVPQALQIKDPAFVVPETRMAAEYLFAKAENDVKKRKGVLEKSNVIFLSQFSFLFSCYTVW